jgi:hypothetical protein
MPNTNIDIYRMISVRRGGPGSVCVRVKGERESGREKGKIATEGQLLAVFECGRILTCVLQRGRCMYENVHPPPRQSNRVFSIVPITFRLVTTAGRLTSSSLDSTSENTARSNSRRPWCRTASPPLARRQWDGWNRTKGQTENPSISHTRSVIIPLIISATDGVCVCACVSSFVRPPSLKGVG